MHRSRRRPTQDLRRDRTSTVQVLHSQFARGKAERNCVDLPRHYCEDAVNYWTDEWADTANSKQSRHQRTQMGRLRKILLAMRDDYA